jgi:hypothetical protein
VQKAYINGSRDSSVGIATGSTAGFDSRLGQEIFLYYTASRPALKPTQPPIQWVLGALSLGIKQPGREADHSPPSTVEVKNGGTRSPLPIRFHGVVLN